MPIYTLPDFNLVMDVWVSPNTPFGGGPADFAAVPCQLYVNNKPFDSIDAATFKDFFPHSFIRIKREERNIMGPLVKSIWQWTDVDSLVWQWTVAWWSQIHPGFPNEYIELCVNQCDTAGNPPDGNR